MKKKFLLLSLLLVVSPIVHALDSSAEEYHEFSLAVGGPSPAFTAETGYVTENILPAIDLTTGIGFEYLSYNSSDPFFGVSSAMGIPLSVGMMFSVSSISVKPYVRAQYDLFSGNLGYDLGAYYTRDTETLGVKLMQRTVNDFGGGPPISMTMIGVSYGMMW